MDYVNTQVAIGGDAGNTVPKFNVPVCEIPVLMAIHGPDALTEFEQADGPEDQDELSNAEELQRLGSIYGTVTDSEGVPILRTVYPGAGARVISSLDDLEIPEGAMKVTQRATVKKDAPKKARKAKAKADEPKADDDKDADVMG